jgi:predicted transcriptional regulator
MFALNGNKDRKVQNELSKRERQIMDVIYRKKSASAIDVLEEISNPPSYSTVRKLLYILEFKGFLRHERRGKRYLYFPMISRRKAMRSALTKLLKTYFDNSIEDAVAALMEIHSDNLADADFDKLIELIEKAKKEGADQNVAPN